MKIITIIDDFSKSPFRRYSSETPKNETDTSGERFREELLVPALKENEQVKVILTGYNRYGRSFLDEAFGGLIRKGYFTYQELQKKLIYEHAAVKSIELLIADRMKSAAIDMGQLDENEAM